MSPEAARVRSRRSEPVVAVTAAGSPVGRAIVTALASRIGRPGGPRAVVAVDGDPPREAPAGPGFPAHGLPAHGLPGHGRPGHGQSGGRLPDGVEPRPVDVTTPAVREALADADVVVHVATPSDLAAESGTGATARRARAVRAVQEVAGAAAAAGAHRLVVVTSAMVLGARPGAAVPLPDDAPVAAERDEGAVGDLLEVERVAARSPRIHPGLPVTVVRPAAVVGPGVDTVITRHFAGHRLLALRGQEMAWQFCHVDDLGEAVAIAVEQDLDGPLTVGHVPWLPASDVERLAGMRRVELPPRLAWTVAERLRRAGALPGSASELSYVVHPWVVSADRLRAAGWVARHDGAECLRLLREHARAEEPDSVRRVDRRDAARGAAGAAGAAVAVLGMAALLRQARARRTGGRRPTL